MISQIRNSVFAKILWGLMGLYLLNICVDTADSKPEHIPEDLTLNDQESIIEIVVEKILGYEDIIKEYDDNDTENHNKKTNIKIDLSNRCTADCTIKQSFIETKTARFPYFKTYLTNGFHQLDFPPPKFDLFYSLTNTHHKNQVGESHNVKKQINNDQKQITGANNTIGIFNIFSCSNN